MIAVGHKEEQVNLRLLLVPCSDQTSTRDAAKQRGEGHTPGPYSASCPRQVSIPSRDLLPRFEEHH